MSVHHHKRKAPHNRQQGVALITALLISALVTVAAVAMASRQQLDIRRTGNMLEADQAYMYALAAEAWGSQILRQDRQTTQIDTLDEDWATQLPPVPIEGGMISGSIEDLQGRFNLNNLIDTNAGSNSTPNQEQIRVLQRILAQVSLVEKDVQLSPFMVNRVADWIDPDLNALADGAEDMNYLSLDVPYRAANRRMVSPTELAAVAGFSLRDVAALAPLIATLPQAATATSGTTVNVNTAPELVLMSLHEDITARIAEELAQYRRATPFEKPEDFVTKLLSDYQITLDPKLVGVSSDYFLITSDAAIGRTSLRMYSLLARVGNDINVVRRGIGSY
ncbi:MAG: type II secretion system minor pseudopilin GspK [Gammaproteobacteria bacterium]|nr:type II secretion system minor pseudopilin GspK [Gammaproteobacteria bacterium]